MSFFKQPQGYYRIFFALLCERLSFFTLMALPANFFSLFLNLSEDAALAFQRAFILLCSLLPLFGGFIAESLLKKRNALLYSLGALGLAYFLLWMGVLSSWGFFFFPAFLLLALGEGLFMPLVSRQLISFYDTKDNPRIEGNFVFFLTASHLGIFFAPLQNMLGTNYSWSGPCLVSFILMSLAFVLNRRTPYVLPEGQEGKLQTRFLGKAFLLFLSILLPLALILRTKEIIFSLYSEGNSSWELMGLWAFFLLFVGGLFFPWFWVRKSEKGQPQKFFSVFLMALASSLLGGLLLLLMVSYFPDVNEIPLFLPATVLTLFAFTELLLVPLATAWIAKEAPARLRASVLGVWLGLISFLALVADFVSNAFSSELVTLTPFVASLLALVLFLVFRFTLFPTQNK